MADAADTVDKLKDLIIREQFVKVCSTELALFLKERKPNDRRDVISLAHLTSGNGGVDVKFLQSRKKVENNSQL
jgi:hypothetical protein